MHRRSERTESGTITGMDDKQKRYLTTFCFFFPSSLVLAYFVFYLATFTPANLNIGPAYGSASAHIVPSSPNKVVLVKGRSQTIGKIEMTYRGLDAGAVLIDITLLELDPQYAYHRKIPRDSARQGFWLAQKHYRMLSAGRSRLRLMRTNG